MPETQYTEESVRAMKTSDILLIFTSAGSAQNPLVVPFMLELEALAARYPYPKPIPEDLEADIKSRAEAEITRVVALLSAELDRRIPVPEPTDG